MISATRAAAVTRSDVLLATERMGPEASWAHFDGTQWNLISSPTPGDSGSLADLEAQSPDHLWAAGTGLTKTLILEAPSRFNLLLRRHLKASGIE